MGWLRCLFLIQGQCEGLKDWDKRIVETPMPFLFPSTNLIFITNLAEFGSSGGIKMMNMKRLFFFIAVTLYGFMCSQSVMAQENNSTLSTLFCRPYGEWVINGAKYDESPLSFNLSIYGSTGEPYMDDFPVYFDMRTKKVSREKFEESSVYIKDEYVYIMPHNSNYESSYGVYVKDTNGKTELVQFQICIIGEKCGTTWDDDMLFVSLCYRKNGTLKHLGTNTFIRKHKSKEVTESSSDSFEESRQWFQSLPQKEQEEIMEDFMYDFIPGMSWIKQKTKELKKNSTNPN